jgi:DNA helicase HerA-like ATPase
MFSFSTKHIDYIERNNLDALSSGIQTDVLGFKMPNTHSVGLLKVSGISKLWEPHRGDPASARYVMADVLAGLYGEKIPFVYLLFGRETGFDLYIGTYIGENKQSLTGLKVSEVLDTVKATMRSAYPGIEFEEEETSTIQDRLKSLGMVALVTGTPTTKIGTEKLEAEQIERLMRGLYGGNWGYIVVASPLEEQDVTSLYNVTLNELRVVTDAQTSTQTKSPVAERYIELLNAYLEKLTVGKTQGMWHVATYIVCRDTQTFNRAKAVVKSIFGGRKSLPDPVRIIECHGFQDKTHRFGQITVPSPPPPGQMQYPYMYLSTLNSEELATLGYLPTEEMPGYFVRDYARFDVASRIIKNEDAIEIGEILDQSLGMGNQYQIRVKDLNRHALIVGVTGTGKTNTCFHMLKQLWKRGIPFLVIEPAKTEYRKLLQSEELGGNLQVFTLGDESVSPFRVNPFEVLPGVSVQSHIDHLKSVFNASFVMYAPMPYVLEQCIHEVYEDKGWDLATNENERGRHRNANPTLTDLYRKVDELVDRLGYERRITMDVKAALKTRINSLRVGGKGLMLDTRKSIPVEHLLQRPTIMELEKIGDDDEKAFLIGLLLMFLYEHYASKGVQEGSGLNHITIVEEAHRLLKNMPLESNYEAANIKGKAVEAFCNILSEIRAYGEGFMILEQIPSKLASDAIKNTNLKIMHRIVSIDDRSSVGGSMNMDLDEVTRVASLTVGQAAVYADGDDSPLHVKVPYSKIPSAEPMTKTQDDTRVREAMKGFLHATDNVYIPFDECVNFCEDMCKHRKDAQKVVDDQGFQESFAFYVLSMIEDASCVIREYPFLYQSVSERRKSQEKGTGLFLCTMIQAVDDYFESRGREYRWQYADVQFLRDSFLKIMSKVMNVYGKEISDEELMKFYEEIKAFQDKYRDLCRRNYDPFVGCRENCVNGLCLYRFNVQALLTDERLDRFFTRSITNKTGDEIWKSLGRACETARKRIISKEVDSEMKKRVSICYAIQKSHVLPYHDWRAYLKERVVEQLGKIYVDQN